MSKREKFISSSEAETKRIASRILVRALKQREDARGALVIALAGELGAGKTRFAQGVADYLGITRNITSPTFVLMKRYDIVSAGYARTVYRKVKNLYHFDCYRINSSKEILDLGWNDIVSDEGNLVLVEWAEKVKGILPNGSVFIKLKGKNHHRWRGPAESGGEKRKIIVKELLG